MSTGFLTFAMSLLLSFSALAAPLEINTHTAAVPEQSFQIAKTWFLPDWQAGSTSRSDKAPSGSGDRQDLACSTYGGCAGIPANATCSQSFSAKGTTCYKSCSCKSGYNRVNNSDICRGCANPCADVSAVATPYGCKTAWSVCPSKCQIAYPDNCRNRTAVPTPYGCQTAWTDCPLKCQTAYPNNCHNRTAVATPNGCQTYFSDCSAKCQVAYPDNCHNRTSYKLTSSCENSCAQGKTLSDCGSRCATGCKAKCDAGYHLSSDQLSCVQDGCAQGFEPGITCGDGYTLSKSGQSGTQYCGKCVVKECAAGSTSCSGATVAVANGYFSGESKCYTCKLCEQANKKTCGQTCIAKTECCNCSDTQKCVNGSCVEKTCAEKGLKDCGSGCIAKTECCNCSGTQKCVNGSCVEKTCAEKGLKTCGSGCIAKSECCGNCTTGYACEDGLCVPQSCQAQGKKICNGACIALTDCCGCTENQKCSNGTCVAKTCQDGGYNTSCYPTEMKQPVQYAGKKCFICKPCERHPGFAGSATECRRMGGFCRSAMCTPAEIQMGSCQGGIVCCGSSGRFCL